MPFDPLKARSSREPVVLPQKNGTTKPKEKILTATVCTFEHVM
jgi:hypothetical protein